MPLKLSLDKLDVWEDSCIQKRSAHLNGKTYGNSVHLCASALDIPQNYQFARDVALSKPLKLCVNTLLGYLYGEPQGEVRATLFLV